MLHVKRLLVPATFSIRSSRVQEFTTRLAEITGAAVHLLYEADESPNADDQSTWSEKLSLVKDQVDDITADAVIEYCERAAIDVIVTGAGGRWSLTNRSPTALANGLIRRADQPVLRIPISSEASDQPAGGVNRIVAPIDFSEYAATALEHAKELAAVYGAALLLYFVAEEHTVAVFSDAGVPSISTLRADPDIAANADEALQQLYTSIGGPETEVSFHVGHGSAARKLLEFSRDHEADLIVMATHGLTGQQPFALGSVTERVVRRSERPIFVLKSLGNSLV